MYSDAWVSLGAASEGRAGIIMIAGTGAMGTGNPELDDYRNHHTRPDDEDGPDFPSAGEFFSKN